jgi:hypothetical protein
LSFGGERYPYREHKPTFWHDSDGDTTFSALMVMIFAPICIIMVLGVYGGILYTAGTEREIADYSSDTNPCLDLKSDNYVVIDKYQHDSCVNVVRYYLDELHYRPMPNSDLKEHKVTLVSPDTDINKFNISK